MAELSFSSMPEEAFSWDCGTQAWSQSPHLVGILITLPPRVTVRLGTCVLNLRRAPSVAMCSVGIFRRNQAIRIGLETLKPQHTQVTAGEPADCCIYCSIPCDLKNVSLLSDTLYWFIFSLLRFR